MAVCRNKHLHHYFAPILSADDGFEAGHRLYFRKPAMCVMNKTFFMALLAAINQKGKVCDVLRVHPHREAHSQIACHNRNISPWPWLHETHHSI